MENYKHDSILLIDDSYIDNLISRKILENNGFADKIIVIDSPQRAIKFLQDCIATQHDFPEIIFLDIRMPEMNGFEFLKEINSLISDAEIKPSIYVLSSSLDPTDLKKIEDNHLVTGFISKPLSNQALDRL